MAWDESKHPRDNDGKLTNGTGTPREFRQNTPYREILNSSKNNAVENIDEQNINGKGPTNVIHTFDPNYVHKDGYIANVRQGTPMSHDEADRGNVNSLFNSGTNGYNNNCQTCVATYWARRMGYDVRALPNENNQWTKLLSTHTNFAFIDKATGKPPQYITYNGGSDTMDMYLWFTNTLKEGQTYSIEYGWKQMPGVGHIVTIERNGYNITAYDPQNDTTLEGQDLLDYLWSETLCDFKLMNLTNCAINETYCDRIMTRR